jgi:glutathione synthase
MSLKIAVQMDPIDTMVVARDTSLAFMIEAQKRGHAIHWYHPTDLWWRDGALHAFSHRVDVKLDEDAHYQTLESRAFGLSEFDVLLIRQDPPFDMGYVSNTYLLERAGPRPFIVNDPTGVRDLPEKISTLRFPDLIASTFVGRNLDALRDFARHHGEIVLKPAFFAGGEGVRKVSFADSDFETIVAAALAEVGNEPLIAQEFIPRVSEGDQRLFVLDGKAIGVVRRMPKAGEFRANLHVGGVAVGDQVSPRHHEIAATVAPLLAEKGILFAGLDVIDGRLTEINVTSPTLVQELKRFAGIDIPALFWDVVEAKLRSAV